MTKPTMTKMIFKVHAQLWESFDAQIRTLAIKRDPFLANLKVQLAPLDIPARVLCRLNHLVRRG